MNSAISNTTITSRLPEYTVSGKGTLILTKELQHQIDYLHQKIGNIEWSGVLFYKCNKGDITNPSELELEASNIYLLDIGTASYTSCDIGAEHLMEMFETIPDAEDMLRGILHTHHSMQAFYSSTDKSELHDNTQNYDYYLSLIVNKSGDYVAKVSYIGEVERTFKYKNKIRQQKTSSEEMLVMIDMNIVKEDTDVLPNTIFQERYEKVKKEKEDKRVPFNAYSSIRNHSPSYNHNVAQSKYSWENETDWEQDVYTYGEGKYNAGRSKGSLWEDLEETERTEKKIKDKSTKSRYSTKEKNAGNIINRQKVSNWLSSGLDIFQNMVPPGENNPVGVEENLKNYDEFFAGVIEEDKEYFLTVMVKNIQDNFEGDDAEEIRKIGCYYMELYEHKYEICLDLYSLFDAYPEYTEQLKEFDNYGA